MIDGQAPAGAIGMPTARRIGALVDIILIGTISATNFPPERNRSSAQVRAASRCSICRNFQLANTLLVFRLAVKRSS
jgi:hypothetical protein